MVRLLFGLLLLSTSAAADPKSHYMIHCMGCHQADGLGMPPDVPSFTNELGRIVALPEGRRYLIQVPGAAQALLDDNQLAEVVNWMLVTFSAETLPDPLTPFSGSEVASYRGTILADPALSRRQIPTMGGQP